jgi:hypothetical protein
LLLPAVYAAAFLLFVLPLQLTFDTAQDYSMIDCPGRFEYKAEQRVAVAFDWASHSRLMAYGFVPCVQVRVPLML